MRRPWFEGSPALAAHGFAPTEVIGHHTRHPNGHPNMVPTDARFVFLPALDPATKPQLWSGIRSLAANIEAARQAEAPDADLQLAAVDDLRFIGRPGLFHGVQVWLLDAAGDKVSSLGWAYLDGKGPEVLEPRLREARQLQERRAA